MAVANCGITLCGHFSGEKIKIPPNTGVGVAVGQAVKVRDRGSDYHQAIFIFAPSPKILVLCS